MKKVRTRRRSKYLRTATTYARRIIEHRKERRGITKKLFHSIKNTFLSNKAIFKKTKAQIH